MKRKIKSKIDLMYMEISNMATAERKRKIDTHNKKNVQKVNIKEGDFVIASQNTTS